MGSDDDRDFFHGTLTDTITEFCRDYGIECPSVEAARSSAPPPPSREHQIGSVIGFRGDAVRGGLAFLAPADLVMATLPVPHDESKSERQLCDWSSEIANQLAGRLKNKLALRALDFEVGTAACFRGVSIKLSFQPSPDNVTCAVVVGKTGARVYLDCSYLRIAPRSEVATLPPVAEGDVVLF